MESFRYRRVRQFNFDRMRNFSWVFVFFFCFLFFPSFSIEIPSATGRPINDYAKIFSDEQVQQLGKSMRLLCDSTSTQIVVVTIPNLEGGDVQETAIEWAKNWGIGQKDKDNGILLFFAMEDRKMSIMVGSGLEGVFPDGAAYDIRTEILTPYFKRQSYYEGVQKALETIAVIVQGEYKGIEKENPFSPTLVIVLLIIFAVVLFFGRKGGGGGRGGGFGAAPLFWGGGFGSRGGGSGFSDNNSFGGGFGGGGFGGGGSSGGW